MQTTLIYTIPVDQFGNVHVSTNDDLTIKLEIEDDEVELVLAVDEAREIHEALGILIDLIDAAVDD